MTDHLGYSGNDENLPNPRAKAATFPEEATAPPDGPGIQDTISYYFTGLPEMTIIFQFFARHQSLLALAYPGADSQAGAGS